MGVRETVFGDYLRARRSLITPESVGLAREPGRRVDGLRRDEVADLAGISKEYYLRLEQGTGHQPSDQVLFALSRALRLDAAALDYMFRLTYRSLSAAGERGGSDWEQARLDPSVAALLDRWSSTPAIVLDTNHDIVASNRLGRAFGVGELDPGRNVMMNTFGPGMRQSAHNWEDVAAESVATFRFHSDPEDPRHREIVEQLSGDPDFQRLWRRHDVRPFQHGEIRTQYLGTEGVNFHFQNLTVPGGGYYMTLILTDAGTPAGDLIAALAAQTPA